MERTVARRLGPDSRSGPGVFGGHRLLQPGRGRPASTPASGVPLEQVADVAGHATTAMTEGVYRHAVGPSVGAHVAAMDALFGSASA
ncbi:MAG: hypothetical protein M0Z95_26120 [Actinomycetota bacterium]|nr:hypothetical protein [Actinomycetota bacterium]